MAEDRRHAQSPHRDSGLTIIRAALAAALALGILATPLVSPAQQPIGLLFLVPSPFLDEAFRQGLPELGYVEGQNIAIEYRSAEGKEDRLPRLAAELVRLKVDVIVTTSPRATAVTRQATRTIPIVFTVSGDPVADGFVASLARPGGNTTGLATLGPELVGKQLELLKAVAPKVSRLAVLQNPSTNLAPPALRQAEIAARALGMQLQILDARTPSERSRRRSRPCAASARTAFLS
jgi:putative ABC transport system substrate-binding protein